MGDRHLNLFYSYNQDNQLIENNLTRAWIVTLGFLSGPARDAWLRLLLQEPFAQIGQNVGAFPTFGNARCALQGWMDPTKTKSLSRSYVLTIAGDALDLSAQEGSSYQSIPDGWIFDMSAGYCLLVEAKLHGNPLDEAQVVAHAKDWLGLSTSALKGRLLAVSWLDVARSIEEIKEAQALTQQESAILNHLAEFLGFYGYHLFHGFHLSSLKPPPRFELRRSKTRPFAHFTTLDHPPNFHLITSA